MYQAIRTLLIGRHASDLPLLHTILSEISTIDIIASADSLPAAIVALDQFRPDLIVLDSRISVDVVLGILEHIRRPERVIFASIVHEIGFRAFEVKQWRSFLRPIDPPHGEYGVSIAMAEENASYGLRGRKLHEEDPIILSLNGSHHIVKVKSILSISSARHYTFVVAEGGCKGLATKSMTEWEERLPREMFFRIHRNVIINLDYVEQIASSGHSYKVFLKGFKEPVSMSIRSFARIKKQLN